MSSADRLRVGPRRPWFKSIFPPTHTDRQRNAGGGGRRQVLIDVGADLQDDGELHGPNLRVRFGETPWAGRGLRRHASMSLKQLRPP